MESPIQNNSPHQHKTFASFATFAVNFTFYFSHMKLLKSFALTSLSLACALTTIAQTLSPAQQAKLNALPPALKAQAMAELGKLQAGSAQQTKPITQPVVVTPRNAATDKRIEAEFQASTGLAQTNDSPEALVVKQALRQFGYNLFAGSPTTFAPATDIPIPVNYVMGPGDQLRIQFFGKESSSYDLYVSREGMLQIPELGPMSVAGLSFSELKAEISRRIADQMIGVEAFVTLGELRSIRIFALGDVNRPGAYTVSSLSTMINALFVSGGIRPIGTLRNIQLKRAGETVTTFDLYDLLLKGDTSADATLQPGDVIFVPPVGSLVGIAGEVKRPAIYELTGGETLESTIAMAGGFTAQAYPSLSQMERISSNGAKEILDVDLSTSDHNITLRDGDTLRIYSTLDRFDNYVRLEGAVERPGDYQWKRGLTLLDILSSRESLLLNADLDYSLVVSKNAITGDWSTRSFSPEFLFSTASENMPLEKEDRIILFSDTAASREQLGVIIAKLRAQSSSEDPQKVVTISGQVKHSGNYPLDEQMTISQLIKAAGGYSESAYTLEAELIRYIDNGKSQRESTLLQVNLAQLSKDGSGGIKLQPFDRILIKRIPEWNEQETITLSGEVRFPGIYTIERGETLEHVVNRAGGLTNLAHPDAAVFLRASLKAAEAQQIAKLKARLSEDIAATRLQANQSNASAISTAESLLDQLEGTEAVGRLVINLSAILAGNHNELRIKGGDQLRIPQQPQAVTIIGSVNYPTSHLYQQNLMRNSYIALSGGLLKNADKHHIYVVRANGQVVADSRSRFFPKNSLEIYAGDTIVVPLNVNRMDALEFWGDISQIIYQIALGAAAVNSF